MCAFRGSLTFPFHFHCHRPLSKVSLCCQNFRRFVSYPQPHHHCGPRRKKKHCWRRKRKNWKMMMMKNWRKMKKSSRNHFSSFSSSSSSFHAHCTLWSRRAYWERVLTHTLRAHAALANEATCKRASFCLNEYQPRLSQSSRHCRSSQSQQSYYQGWEPHATSRLVQIYILQAVKYPQ